MWWVGSGLSCGCCCSTFGCGSKQSCELCGCDYGHLLMSWFFSLVIRWYWCCWDGCVCFVHPEWIGLRLWTCWAAVMLYLVSIYNLCTVQDQSDLFLFLFALLLFHCLNFFAYADSLILPNLNHMNLEQVSKFKTGSNINWLCQRHNLHFNLDKNISLSLMFVLQIWRDKKSKNKMRCR